MPHMRWLLILSALLIAWRPAAAEQKPAHIVVAHKTRAPAMVSQSLTFQTSDGVSLHYTVKGPANAPFMVFVPGWAMPGWIFGPQEAAFDKNWRVVLFDPRGQGSSEIAPSGYNQTRRGQDIAELLARLPGRVVLVGWSLGVLDTLAYVHQNGDAKLKGLVLVDNSVGENPPPVPHAAPPGPPMTHEQFVRWFVPHMFKTKQPAGYLERLTDAALRLPEADANALLRYPVPRTYWKQALLGCSVPVLYAVRPKWQEQAENLQADRNGVTVVLFPTAGHALFVDDAARFNAALKQFAGALK